MKKRSTSRLLRRLLFRLSSPFQLLVAVLGALAGTAGLLASVQFLLDVQDFRAKANETFGSNVFVIQKRTTTMSALMPEKDKFFEKEIDELRAMPFVEDVGPFVRNDFDVRIQPLKGKGLPDFTADIFMESVPKEFVDVEVDGWEWDSTRADVPIIFPIDYLLIINHAFGPSQNIPKISEDVFKSFPLKVTVGNRDSVHMVFQGRVVGFSQKINTILVPLEFLHYTNRALGKGTDLTPSRLMVRLQEDSYADFEKLVEDKNLQVADTSLQFAKLKSFLSVLMWVMLGMGLVLFVVSTLAMVQYAQIIINRTRYELRTLKRIGWASSRLAGAYNRYFLLFYIGIVLLAVAAVWFIKDLYLEWASEQGFTFTEGISIWTWALAGVCFVIVILTSVWSVRRGISSVE